LITITSKDKDRLILSIKKEFVVAAMVIQQGVNNLRFFLMKSAKEKLDKVALLWEKFLQETI
jgi:hypothetical protein